MLLLLVHLLILALASTASLAAPSNTTTRNNTVNLFIDGVSEGISLAWAGSIIEACANETVYAVTCTSSAGSLLSGTLLSTITLTEGSSVYLATQTRAQLFHGGLVREDSCTLLGTTTAVCQVTEYQTVSNGMQTTVVPPSTIAGSNYHRFDVAITAGTNKTVNPGSCIETASAGATTAITTMSAPTASTKSGAVREASPKGRIVAMVAVAVGLARMTPF